MTNWEILPVFQSPDGMKEMSDWVKTHSTENVACWAEQILKNNQQAYPELLWKQTITGAGALATIVQAEHDLTFQQNVWNGLELLTGNIEWDHLHHEDVEYVANLLTVIGSLKVQPLYDVLVQLTDQKTLIQENLGEEAGYPRTDIRCTLLSCALEV